MCIIFTIPYGKYINFEMQAENIADQAWKLRLAAGVG